MSIEERFCAKQLKPTPRQVKSDMGVEATEKSEEETIITDLFPDSKNKFWQGITKYNIHTKAAQRIRNNIKGMKILKDSPLGILVTYLENGIPDTSLEGLTQIVNMAPKSSSFYLEEGKRETLKTLAANYFNSVPVRYRILANGNNNSIPDSTNPVAVEVKVNQDLTTQEGWKNYIKYNEHYFFVQEQVSNREIALKILKEITKNPALEGKVFRKGEKNNLFFFLDKSMLSAFTNKIDTKRSGNEQKATFLLQGDDLYILVYEIDGYIDGSSLRTEYVYADEPTWMSMKRGTHSADPFIDKNQMIQGIASSCLL